MSLSLQNLAIEITGKQIANLCNKYIPETTAKISSIKATIAHLTSLNQPLGFDPAPAIMALRESLTTAEQELDKLDDYLNKLLLR